MSVTDAVDVASSHETASGAVREPSIPIDIRTITFENDVRAATVGPTVVRIVDIHRLRGVTAP